MTPVVCRLCGHRPPEYTMAICDQQWSSAVKATFNPLTDSTARPVRSSADRGRGWGGRNALKLLLKQQQTVEVQDIPLSDVLSPKQ